MDFFFLESGVRNKRSFIRIWTMKLDQHILKGSWFESSRALKGISLKQKPTLNPFTFHNSEGIFSIMFSGRRDTRKTSKHETSVEYNVIKSLQWAQTCSVSVNDQWPSYELEGEGRNMLFKAIQCLLDGIKELAPLKFFKWW